MQRYHIKIYLTGNNVIDEKAEADSLEDAVDKIATSDKAKQLFGDNEIESIQLIDTERIEPPTKERFIVQESPEPSYWVITDQESGLVCKFLERQYSKDYKITALDGKPVTDLITMANALSEMGNYLMGRHPELIC